MMLRNVGNNALTGEYTGKRKIGKMHGMGIMVWPDGSRYEGSFEHDWISGFGKFTFSDGSTYEVEFLDGICADRAEYTASAEHE